MADTLTLVKVILPATATFFAGIAITPAVARVLYRYKAWKKESVQYTTDGREATITKRLHADEVRKVPRMGGVVVWLSVLMVTAALWLASVLDGPLADKLNFLSRNQTWLPLVALLVGAAIGLVDDLYAVWGKKDQKGGGLSSKKRLLLVGGAALVMAWWFYTRLGVSEIIIPYWGPVDLGVLFLPFFIAVMIGVYAGGVIDGLDGLSGGVFASIFAAYGFIAFSQQQIDLAAFSFSILGGLLAFLWFNIPPARFYLSDTGTTALALALTVIAFLTRQVAVLPIVAALLFAAAGSSALQLLSKRFRGKKIFLVAPFHHHLQAKGWPPEKVTMRLWILGIMFAFLGVIVAITGVPAP